MERKAVHICVGMKYNFSHNVSLFFCFSFIEKIWKAKGSYSWVIYHEFTVITWANISVRSVSSERSCAY